MTSGVDFRALKTEEEMKQVARCLALAFASANVEEELKGLKKEGIEFDRILAEGDKVLGCLRRHEIGQYYCGKLVSMVGLSNVGVTPESRRRGFGRELIARDLQESKDKGFALSTLYGASQQFYRTNGYERAGVHCLTKIPLWQLHTDSWPVSVREEAASWTLRSAEATDWPQLEAMQQEFARLQQGALVRNETLWKLRRGDFRTQPDETVLFESEDRELQGYLVYRLKRPQHPELYQTLELRDFVAPTPAALCRLFQFCQGFRSLARFVCWTGALANNILAVLDEVDVVTTSVFEHWMLRVVDVEKALTERGYPVGLTTSFGLSLTDHLFEDNNGHFLVHIHEQTASVQRVSEPKGAEFVSADIRDFASLYSGFQQAHDLWMAGRLVGDKSAREKVNAVFCNGLPMIQEDF